MNIKKNTRLFVTTYFKEIFLLRSEYSDSSSIINYFSCCLCQSAFQGIRVYSM